MKKSILKKLICASLISLQVGLLLPSNTVLATTNTSQQNIKYFVVKNGNEETFKEKFFSSRNFRKSWALIAHSLGYINTNGTKSNQIGEDYTLKKDFENGKAVYYLIANYTNNTPYSHGLKSNERLKIKISNIRFVTDPNTFSLGKSKIVEQKAINVGESIAHNFGDVSDTRTSSVTFSKTNSISRTDEFKFSEKIGIASEFEAKIPFVGGGKLTTTFEFNAEQGWSNTKETSDTTENQESYTLTMPPKSKRFLRAITLQTKSEIPYEAKAILKYDVTFIGQAYQGGISWDPFDGGYTPYPTEKIITFGTDKLSANEHLLDMYVTKDTTLINWTEASKKLNPNIIKKSINALNAYRPALDLKGKFTTINGNNTKIIAGPNEPLTDADYEALDYSSPRVSALTSNKNHINTEENSIDLSESNKIILRNIKTFDCESIKVKNFELKSIK